MCLSGQDKEEREEEEEKQEEVRGEVRLPVVVNDSSTQQHSQSQPSICFPFGDSFFLKKKN